MAILSKRQQANMARNAHLPNIAKRALDSVSSIIQQQHHNSLQVAGYAVFIYTRMKGGPVCTCSFAHSISNSAPLYDEQGHVAATVIQSITNQAQFGIEEYNSETPFAARTQENVETVTNISTGSYVVGETDLDLVTETSLNSFSSGACNVCQGTGYKGGYHFNQGMRWILDTTDIFDSSGIEIDRTTGPYTFKFLDPSAWISFKINLPLVSSNIIPACILWNNHARVTGLAGPYNLVTVTPANPSVPAYSLATGVKSSGISVITLHASNFMLADPVAFTHLEIQLPTQTNPVYVDIPNLVTNYDPLRTSLYSSGTFTLSPNTPLLSPMDVISDMTHKLHWIVTGVRPVSPSAGQIWSQDVDVRPVEPHEAMSSLLLPLSSWLPYNGSKIVPAHKSNTYKGGY